MKFFKDFIKYLKDKREKKRGITITVIPASSNAKCVCEEHGVSGWCDIHKTSWI